MRLVEATIENCRSYRLAETVRLNEESTILVGRNGGAKSNTLDILTISLRKFFLPTYSVSEGSGSSESPSPRLVCTMKPGLNLSLKELSLEKLGPITA